MKPRFALLLYLPAILISGCGLDNNNLAPEINLSQLNIDSNPSGTDVYIDNNPLPLVTPATINLPVAYHHLKLTRNFYQDVEIDYLAKKDEAETINIVLTSSLYPYTGAWLSKGAIDLMPEDNLRIQMNLKVVDDIITGIDQVSIGDTYTPSGTCAGKIKADQTAEVLCKFSDPEHTTYWKSTYYWITPLNHSEISARLLFLDFSYRIKGGALFKRTQ